MAAPSACRPSRTELVAHLRREAPVLLPSMLLCDFGHLYDEVRRLEAAGAKALHLDVMDGHFVPNFTYGLPIVEAVRQATELPLDVHLMMSRPGQYLEHFRRAGADLLTIHVEAEDDPAECLAEIRRLGAAAGLALNPPTPLDRVRPYLGQCDLVLVMSVMPGFGGQAFDPAALDKLRELRREFRDGPLLEVDGGVHDGTIGDCAQAGAELFVAGSAILKHDDYSERIRHLTALAAAAITSRTHEPRPTSRIEISPGVT